VGSTPSLLPSLLDAALRSNGLRYAIPQVGFAISPCL
jgi:hypothetical protein